MLKYPNGFPLEIIYNIFSFHNTFNNFSRSFLPLPFIPFQDEFLSTSVKQPETKMASYNFCIKIPQIPSSV
jgi:hypothetical protein